MLDALLVMAQYFWMTKKGAAKLIYWVVLRKLVSDSIPLPTIVNSCVNINPPQEVAMNVIRYNVHDVWWTKTVICSKVNCGFLCISAFPSAIKRKEKTAKAGLYGTLASHNLCWYLSVSIISFGLSLAANRLVNTISLSLVTTIKLSLTGEITLQEIVCH